MPICYVSFFLYFFLNGSNEYVDTYLPFTICSLFPFGHTLSFRSYDNSGEDSFKEKRKNKIIRLRERGKERKILRVYVSVAVDHFSLRGRRMKAGFHHPPGMKSVS